MSATCQHCGAKTSSSPDVARRDGWILWEGDTLGGQHVTREYCPECAGRTKTNEDEARGYNASCWTCMENASDELGGITKAEAEEWAEDHHCEPDVRVEELKPVRARQ